MQDDSSISDDPGTILDSYASIPAAMPAAAGRPISPSPGPKDEEVLYRPLHRWTAPRLLICDDGSLEEGETVYLRSDKFVIGRASGDIVIGHDVAMSASHAEISREDSGGEIVWVLHDLKSSNGTFVRVKRVTLKNGTVIQLGSKRYRFEIPGSKPCANLSRALEQPTVMLEGLQGVSVDLLPALVDFTTAGSEHPVRLPFKSINLTIGRPSCGNDIEIDDMCLARTHAVVSRDVTGTWKLESRPSLNGIWVKAKAIPLKDNSYFQCGEHRFRFRL